VQRYFDEHDMFVPIKFLAGNVFDIDASSNIKYDKIYCGAGCSPDHANFFKQLLDINGQLLAPVTDASGSALVRYTRTSLAESPASFASDRLMGVRFADLIPTSAPPSHAKFVMEASSNSRTQTLPAAISTPSSTSQALPRAAPLPSGFLSTLPSASPPPSSPQVFLSINVRSSAAIASRCVAFLQSHGIKAWLCTQDLAGGASFREEIVRAVCRAPCFVSVLLQWLSCTRQVQACSVFVPLVTTEWALSGECEIECVMFFIDNALQNCVIIRRYNFALRLNLTSHEKGRTQRNQVRKNRKHAAGIAAPNASFAHLNIAHSRTVILDQPRLPVLLPIAFPGLDWDAHPSIQLLAGLLQQPANFATRLGFIQLYRHHQHAGPRWRQRSQTLFRPIIVAPCDRQIPLFLRRSCRVAAACCCLAGKQQERS
jgi:hypothetical protein